MKAICSINGIIRSLSEAKLDLTAIETQYNFGVYETVKVRNTLAYFVPQHIHRLFHSASCIQLQHQFSVNEISTYLQNFIAEVNELSCNIKILLYGSSTPRKATLYLLASTPMYPDRKWYTQGVTLMSYMHERWMPQAKTVNMLPSYYIYALAKQKDSYDALLLDRENNILEGTRTNVYVIQGNTLYSPPKDAILEGVTMMTLEKVIKNSEYSITYKPIPLSSLQSYDGMIVTSTSSKILPVRKVDSIQFSTIAPSILKLEKLYDEALKHCGGDFNKL